MGRVMWDPDLRLSLGRSADAPASDSSGGGNKVEEEEPFSATSTRHLQQQQQITMFYKGQICVCDVTEIQARSIISMAKREMDARVETNSSRQHQERGRQSIQSSSSPQGAAPPSSTSQSSPAVQQLLNPSGLSMKRSLQRFLEKRKTRADDVSPYSHKRPFFFPIKS